MNICFITGKIITELKFNFIINRDLNLKKCAHTSIIQFKMELENKSYILVKGYDEMADECYRRLKKGRVIVLIGKLNTNMEIILQDFKIIL